MTNADRDEAGPATERDRFYVQRDKHPYFQKLAQGEDAPFRQIKDVWILAAATGYKVGRKQQLRGGAQHIGFWHYLSSQEDVPLLQAIAIAETGDVAVLANQGEVIKIAEEYANAGIDVLLDDEHGESRSTIQSLAASIAAGARAPTLGDQSGAVELVDTVELISRGESAKVEFKQSARWNSATKQAGKEIEHEIAKAICGFMNAKGGTLLIGVTDSGEVAGLSSDYKLMKGRSSSRDAFENWLTTLVGNELGLPSLAHVSVTFEEIDDRDICRVDVDPSDTPVYAGKDAIFYVRANNSTRKMNAREANEYSLQRWRQ